MAGRPYVTTIELHAVAHVLHTFGLKALYSNVLYNTIFFEVIWKRYTPVLFTPKSPYTPSLRYARTMFDRDYITGVI